MTGTQLRDQGIARVSSPPENEEWIGYASRAAILLARRKGTVCADEVHAYLETNQRNYDTPTMTFNPDPPNPNCWGAAFNRAAKTGKIRSTDRIVRSDRVTRQSGTQLVWEYVG